MRSPSRWTRNNEAGRHDDGGVPGDLSQEIDTEYESLRQYRRVVAAWLMGRDKAAWSAS